MENENHGIGDINERGQLFVKYTEGQNHFIMDFYGILWNEILKNRIDFMLASHKFTIEDVTRYQ